MLATLVLKPLRFCSKEDVLERALLAVVLTCEMAVLLLSAVDLASFAVLTVASKVLPCSVIFVLRPLAVCSRLVTLLIAPDAVLDTSETCEVIVSEVCLSAEFVA